MLFIHCIRMRRNTVSFDILINMNGRSGRIDFRGARINQSSRATSTNCGSRDTETKGPVHFGATVVDNEPD